jgi:adenosylmethionine-8-amino-7-oxononanoate aminotransferase
LFESAPPLQQVAAIEQALRIGLEPCHALPGVTGVRVMGAIGVVELERIDDVEGLRARFADEGLFIRPLGNIAYLTPAFTISAADLATLTGAIQQELARLGSIPPVG